VNSKNRKTLEAIFADPFNGNIDWSRIESLLIAIGCAVYEKGGSAVAFDKDGISVHFHRPHPGRAALLYRVKAAREFLQEIGVTP
jgi:hypothetical protein